MFKIFQNFCEHQHICVNVHRYWISAVINIWEVISSSLESPWIVEKEKNLKKFFLLMLTLSELFKVKNVFNVDARKKSTNTHYKNIFKHFCSLWLYLSNKKIIFKKYVVFSEKSIILQNSHYLHRLCVSLWTVLEVVFSVKKWEFWRPISRK